MKRDRSLLRVLRAQQEPKMSQRQLALKAGLSPSRYWQIESGEGSEPSRDEKDAVAAALGVKAADIAWPTFLQVQAS